jgi:hypothetical protein
MVFSIEIVLAGMIFVLFHDFIAGRKDAARRFP